MPKVPGAPSASPPTSGPASGPTSGTTLRVANQRRVLSILLAAGGGSISQSDLGRESGLAPATVSSIVRDLAKRGIVTTVPGAGRRATTVQLGRGAGLVLGVDVGHRHLAVVLGDMTGAVVGSMREDVGEGLTADRGLSLAHRMALKLLADEGADLSAVRSVGLGLPAPVVRDVVLASAILPAWEGVNVREEAEALFGRPVHIENDANLGALAEHRLGAGVGHDDVVYVKVSSGVGAGLVLGGRIFRGSDGTAGEIGHLTLDDQGPLCRCGSRGCLEAYASTRTTVAMMAGQLPGATLDEVITAARQGNVAALRVFEDAGLHLGWGLAAVTNLVNPGIIVIGGDMGHAGDLLLDSARVGLRRHVLAGAAATPVVPAALGDSASAVGALLLAIDATDLALDPA